MAVNQPTVLVKKADGTFVRMPLDQIKRGPMKTPTSTLASPVPAKASVETIAQPRPVASPSPVKVTSLASPGRQNQVEEILKKVKFKVAADNLQNRLRSIIQLYLKDIRSADQTRDKVRQSVGDGGLGLGEKEAEDLLTVCDIILDREKKNKNLTDVPVLKKKAGLPMVEPQELPSTTAPFNSFVRGTAATPSPTKPAKPVVPAPVSSRPQNILSAKPVSKVVMEDVQAPRPAEMGPIEEIQYMTLTDFRRLSAKPEEAAARFKQKFINLRDESIVLFMDALSAWQKSPLYSNCLQIICQSLKERRKLSALASGEADKIKLEELMAIVKMESELE